MLDVFTKKLETYLNADEELKRRLEGFKNFSGHPDGHYERARAEGDSALARAVRCYPFGGESDIKNCEVVGIRIADGDEEFQFVIRLDGQTFSVTTGSFANPLLSVGLSKQLFKEAILGRYRWVWLFGMDEVELTYSNGLPHSDWVTILEICVTMQELVEFDKELWQAAQNY
jgi:hypothetical protein